MSTPELTRWEDLNAAERRALCGAYTRTDQVVSWIGWHIGELVAVGLPLLLAATITWWLLALSVLAGGLWAGHEWRLHRQQRRQVEHARRALPSREQDTTDAQAAETSRQGGEVSA